MSLRGTHGIAIPVCYFLCLSPSSPRYSVSPFFPFEAFSFCFSALLFLPYQCIAFLIAPHLSFALLFLLYQPVPLLIGLRLFHDRCSDTLFFLHLAVPSPRCFSSSLFLRLSVPSLSTRAFADRLLPFPRLTVPPPYFSSPLYSFVSLSLPYQDAPLLIDLRLFHA